MERREIRGHLASKSAYPDCAEPVIERAFARPVGFIRATRLRLARTTRRNHLQPQLLLALAEGAQAERVEFYETRGVAVIIGDRALLEGDEVLIVK
jgi:hypothetical protein